LIDAFCAFQVELQSDRKKMKPREKKEVKVSCRSPRFQNFNHDDSCVQFKMQNSKTEKNDQKKAKKTKAQEARSKRSNDKQQTTLRGSEKERERERERVVVVEEEDSYIVFP
jgi:hypothetical protein